MCKICIIGCMFNVEFNVPFGQKVYFCKLIVYIVYLKETAVVSYRFITCLVERCIENSIYIPVQSGI